jgi:hypothetical protein
MCVKHVIHSPDSLSSSSVDDAAVARRDGMPCPLYLPLALESKAVHKVHRQVWRYRVHNEV